MSQGPPPPSALREWFGDLDVYVFDQLLKGRLAPPMRVLDAGCGGGRNVHYLLSAGFDVHAVDASPEAVAQVRALAGRLAPHLPNENFTVSPLETAPLPNAAFDAVISVAVLHFSRDEAQFEAVLRTLWRVLRPGGMLLVRTASREGMEKLVQPLAGRRHRMPAGNELFLVDQEYLEGWTDRLGAEPLEPIRHTIVARQRCMSTWVVRRPA